MKLFVGEIFPEVRILDEEQAHIIKVLRMKDGESITITDGQGNIATGILKIEGKKAHLAFYQISQNTENFSSRLHIAIAPTKNIDRIEFFIEKAVELGISEITLLMTEKTERKNMNIEKLMKQAVAASKQSLRFYFPVINDFTKLQDFIAKNDPSNTFVAHCNESLKRVGLHDLPVSANYTFLIGPEGDFSEKEIQILADKGIKAVSLGNQRLRTETAGIFVAAWNYQKMMG